MQSLFRRFVLALLIAGSMASVLAGVEPLRTHLPAAAERAP